MKSLKQNGFWMAVAVFAVAMASAANAQGAQTATAKDVQSARAEAGPVRELVVSLQDRKLAL